MTRSGEPKTLQPDKVEAAIRVAASAIWVRPRRRRVELGTGWVLTGRLGLPHLRPEPQGRGNRLRRTSRGARAGRRSLAEHDRVQLGLVDDAGDPLRAGPDRRDPDLGAGV